MAVVSKDEVFLRRPPLWLALHVSGQAQDHGVNDTVE